MARHPTHQITITITIDFLKRAAGKKDRKASEQLANFITGVVKKILKGKAHQEIEDAAQEAFKAVIEAVRASQYDSAQPDKNGWVARIAIRKAIDVHRLRKKRELLSAEETQGPDSPNPVSHIERQQDAGRILALGDLDAATRTLLVLRYRKDMSQEEIADELSIPVGTVKSRLNRALEQVRKLLGLPARGPDDV